MNPEKRPFRITWKETAFALILLLMLWTGLTPTSRVQPGVRANATAKNGKAIYNFLQAYAKDNNGQFPEAPRSSNEAFRQLFVKKYLDAGAEQGFAISNDPWLNHAPHGFRKPDNDIGNAPDFAKALQPGECSWAYVTGLSKASEPTLPIMANAFSETAGVYSTDKTKKGGVFLGQKAIWIAISGTTRVQDLKQDLRVIMKRAGREFDVFQSGWGTRPENIRNPAD